jgi:hypothetical protein
LNLATAARNTTGGSKITTGQKTYIAPAMITAASAAHIQKIMMQIPVSSQ